jgi:hypothetical protein
MNMFCRLLGFVVLLLCIVGILACGAALGGAWMVQQQSTPKIDEARGRLEEGLGKISSDLQDADQSLGEASGDLDGIRRTLVELSGTVDVDSRMMTQLQTLVSQRLAPKTEGLNERLAVVNAMVPMLNDLLANVSQLDAVAGGSIDRARLDDAITQTNDLSLALQRLQQLVGKGGPLSRQAISERADAIAAALKAARAATAAWRSEVIRVKEKTPELAGRVKRWILLSAVAITVVGSWFILAQLSLLVHAWGWVRGPGAPDSSPHR